MVELQELLKKLVTSPGISGFEAPVRDLVTEVWKPLTDEIRVSKLGSLYGLQRGTGPEPRLSVLVAAHMDTIGLMVTHLKEGFLHVTAVGGVDPRILPGQPVTVHGRQDLPAVVVQPPPHTLPEEARSGAVPIEHLLVDTGLEPEKTHQLVQAGDLVSFAVEAVEMEGGLLVGHSLDNRASLVALTEALAALKDQPHAWDLWAVATVQEEVFSMAGAATSGYELRPTLAVVVDVTHAQGPGMPGHLSVSLDRGPSLDWGPNTHPKLHQAFKELAERLEIPHQIDVYPRSSGTDALGLQVAREGIPTMLMSVPLRYMHNPVEMVKMKDISRAARLLAAFVAELEADFMDKLRWDEEQDAA